MLVRICFFIDWLVCQWDYTKSSEQIPTKLGWRIGLSPEVTPITFGADLDKGTDQVYVGG